MPIEVESPEELGYDTITNNLSESSVADRKLSDLGLDLDLDELVLCYGDHLGDPLLRQSVAAQSGFHWSGRTATTSGSPTSSRPPANWRPWSTSGAMSSRSACST